MNTDFHVNFAGQLMPTLNVIKEKDLTDKDLNCIYNLEDFQQELELWELYNAYNR